MSSPASAPSEDPLLDQVMAESENIDPATIAAEAYRIWQQNGCPADSDQQDWYEAERSLRTRTP